MTDIRISAHGARRARKRLGLKRKAIPRVVAAAWQRGMPANPLLREINPDLVIKLWRGAYFVFNPRAAVPILVTVLDKPHDERRQGLVAEAEFAHWRGQRKSQYRRFRERME